MKWNGRGMQRLELLPWTLLRAAGIAVAGTTWALPYRPIHLASVFTTNRRPQSLLPSQNPAHPRLASLVLCSLLTMSFSVPSLDFVGVGRG